MDAEAVIVDAGAVIVVGAPVEVIVEAGWV